MDVGGAGFHRARDERVDEADDGRFARTLAQACKVGFGGFRAGAAGRETRVSGFSIQAAQALLDIGGQGALHDDLLASRQRERGDHEAVERIGGGDGQRLCVGAEQDRRVLLEEALGDGLGQHGFQREVFGIGERNAQARFEFGDEVTLWNEAELEQDLDQAHLEPGRHATRALGAVRIDLADRQQVLHQPVFRPLFHAQTFCHILVHLQFCPEPFQAPSEIGP